MTVDEAEKNLVEYARDVTKLQQRRRMLLDKVAVLDAQIAATKQKLRDLVPADSDEGALLRT